MASWVQQAQRWETTSGLYTTIDAVGISWDVNVKTALNKLRNLDIIFQANINSDNMKLVAAILVAALYPNVVQVRTPESKYSQTSEGESRQNLKKPVKPVTVSQVRVEVQWKQWRWVR